VNFGLSEEQELLQETLNEFCARELPPPRLRALFDAGAGRDPALWKGLAELGVLGLLVPEAHGGAGLELLDAALVSEVLGRHALPAPFLGHSLVSLALARAGSDAQRRAWLPRLAAGEAVGALALAEDAGSWEPETWRTSVAGGRLSGAKAFAAGALDADLLAVGVAGGGLVLVERRAPGVFVEDQDGVDRTRSIARLRFESAPCEPLAGGAETAGRVRDAGLCLLAADAFGAAWRLIQASVEHARGRRQFGTPLAQFQAVKHQLANMALDVDPTRGLWWYAAHAFDHAPGEAPRAAALAKAHITDRAQQVARDAVEAHGGIGFTWECDVHFWLKRAIFDRTWLGSPEAHRERLARLAGYAERRRHGAAEPGAQTRVAPV
jgi:alkylation response protein AidB-like acyl-CoA dehydrogenase